jgi:cytochrome c-type biogenesis protein CcmE
MKNRKRMWILGTSFLVASALVYLIFMMSWVNVSALFKTSSIMNIIVGTVALLGGLFNLYSFYKQMKVKDVGCTVTNATQKKK